MLPDDLNNNVISMPPLTLVTVDEGYSAVTEDNGKQRILPGGKTYLLDHRNWKFQKFISQKIQSNNLDRISATSADNVLMVDYYFVYLSYFLYFYYILYYLIQFY